MLKQLLFGVWLYLGVTVSAFAVCPLCTFMVGAGIGLTQYLGVDDTISGLWLGAFLGSASFWTVSWCRRQGIWFLGLPVLVALLYYLGTLWSLAWYGILGHYLNKLWGIDRLLLGMLFGTLLLILTTKSYEYLKARNANKAYFPFQKVAMPLGALLMGSGLLYLMTK